MKKNAMLKIAAILLVAVLLTTCAISATFAKYVTAKEYAGASARVAKWGVSVDVTGTPFAKIYSLGGNQVVFGAEEVVAPGTQGEDVITITVDATQAEVAYEILSELKVDFTGDWTANGATYIPIVFTIDVDGTESTVNFDGATDVANASQTITDEINEAVSAAASYEKATAAKVVKISWAWDEGDDAADIAGLLASADNTADTILGNKAEGLKIAISGSVAVVQVTDNYAVA